MELLVADLMTEVVLPVLPETELEALPELFVLPERVDETVLLDTQVPEGTELACFLSLPLVPKLAVSNVQADKNRITVALRNSREIRFIQVHLFS